VIPRTDTTHRERRLDVHPATQHQIDRMNRFDAVLAKVVVASAIAIAAATVIA
jgi:hypothetical protein